MDFDRVERGVEVQSEWDFEREWTLAIKNAVWRSKQREISSRIGLSYEEKQSGGPNSIEFQGAMKLEKT